MFVAAWAELSGGMTWAVCNLGERRLGVERSGGTEVCTVLGSMMLGAGESEGGVGWKPTLGSAARAGEGTHVGLVGAGWAATANMLASCWMASIWASPMEARGDAGAGLQMAQQRSMAAQMAALVEES
jgi:hypothetical protein